MRPEDRDLTISTEQLNERFFGQFFTNPSSDKLDLILDAEKYFFGKKERSGI